MNRIVCMLGVLIAFPLVTYSQNAPQDSLRGEVKEYVKGDVRKGAESEMIRDRLDPRFNYEGNENTFCQRVMYDLSPFGFDGKISIELAYLFDVDQNIKMECLTLNGSPMGKKNSFTVDFPKERTDILFYDKKRRLISIPVVATDRNDPTRSKLIVMLMDR